MPRTARQVLATLLIALHATISLCGPGLHAAPGLGHGGSSVASRLEGRLDSSKVKATPAEHCSVCEFFAQGQLPVERVALTSARFVVRFEPAHWPVVLPGSLPLGSRSRAPPLGDARIV